ncbi:uncharacterized protein LTR77_001040 [Saxophila tyrrhenica]|uniref:Enoyl reductase (ER) domain-containing protein n=1 Tax=Saxophila tyrrhenica TaxID=1690608 RepID=A0AAV9PSZ7_9PEZI|nr:hypothetical protein LTR77_001040 [Saxophila tyrrhenica]
MEDYALLREAVGVAGIQRANIPNLRDDYISVRVVAVALNPTDHTTLDAPGDNGTIVGCVYASVVEEVGSAVMKPFKKGDRIAGFAHGGNDANPENGALARYIAVNGDIQMHIPDAVSFEEAATVGIGVGTAGYALYKVLGLPLPPVSPAGPEKTILIYGGSTATGTPAIQLAKLSGWKVITTSSPQHFDLLRSLGADIVLDYRVQDIGQQINTATGNALARLLDCVTTPSIADMCAQALSTRSDVGEKLYCNLLGPEVERPDVKGIFFLVYSSSGEAYTFEGSAFSAAPEDFEFAKKWYGIAEKLWMERNWKAHPHRIEKGGLAGLEDGMKKMRNGEIRGVKLVFRVEDTDWPCEG